MVWTYISQILRTNGGVEVVELEWNQFVTFDQFAIMIPAGFDMTKIQILLGMHHDLFGCYKFIYCTKHL
jgi:hypothetical protein